MSEHPLNLAVRFFLELCALFALGYWGWSQHAGMWRLLLGVGAPLLAASLWGIFRNPGDHGKGHVPVAGPVRLALEAVFFTAAVWALAAAGKPFWAWALAGAVVLHYLVSYDRLLRLARGR
jgi:hypothetical protein